MQQQNKIMIMFWNKSNTWHTKLIPLRYINIKIYTISKQFLITTNIKKKIIIDLLYIFNIKNNHDNTY